jgi:hypothetical protein
MKNIGILEKCFLPVLSPPEVSTHPIHYSQLYSKFILLVGDKSLKDYIDIDDACVGVARPLTR